jgi:hypothetical protein
MVVVERERERESVKEITSVSVVEHHSKKTSK